MRTRTSSGSAPHCRTSICADTRSYEEVVGRVRRRLASARPGEWIVGRGWDQNDWAEKDWPTHELLSAASPDNPVYLTRVDGHAGLANRKAMELGWPWSFDAGPAWRPDSFERQMVSPPA